MTERLHTLSAEETQAIITFWQQYFPDVTITINPYLSLEHQIEGMPHTIAVATYKVIQGNNGLLHYVSTYDIYGLEHTNSYISNLHKLGMKVQVDNAVHHMGIDMSPLDFTARTIVALQRLLTTMKTVATTANTRGTVSIAQSNGIVDLNGNGNGAGINVGYKK